MELSRDTTPQPRSDLISFKELFDREKQEGLISESSSFDKWLFSTLQLQNDSTRYSSNQLLYAKLLVETLPHYRESGEKTCFPLLNAHLHSQRHDSIIAKLEVAVARVLDEFWEGLEERYWEASDGSEKGAERKPASRDTITVTSGRTELEGTGGNVIGSRSSSESVSGGSGNVFGAGFGRSVANTSGSGTDGKSVFGTPVGFTSWAIGRSVFGIPLGSNSENVFGKSDKIASSSETISPFRPPFGSNAFGAPFGSNSATGSQSALGIPFSSNSENVFGKSDKNSSSSETISPFRPPFGSNAFGTPFGSNSGTRGKSVFGTPLDSGTSAESVWRSGGNAFGSATDNGDRLQE